MRKYYLFITRMMLVLSFGLFIGLEANAQDRTVTGTVKDADSGESVPGVNIVIKGTANGTVTDFDGNYALSVPENAVLVFSFVGYATQEVTVGSQSTINIDLEFEASQLDEIVVTGYGEVKKGDLTGAIVTVSTDDFNVGAIASPQDLLVGKVAGVVITSQGGAAGTGSTIRIRGGSSLRANNDPLIVIDGIPLESSGISGMANPLSTINPNDIETFTVLKDASATAIFGSRASNGVILITTKQGGEGKMVISYNGNVAVGVPIKTLDVYNGDDYRAVIQDRVDNFGLSPAALDGLGTANTNWQDEIYQNAISTDHSVSVSGAVKSMPYRVSVGYTNQSGILKYNNLERTSFSVSATPSLLNDDLVISINARGSFIDNNFSNDDAIGSAIRFDPTQPITNGNTRYGGYTAWTELTSGDPINGVPKNIATHNPVALLEYRDNTSKTQRYIVGGKIDYTLPFLPELKATLNLGYDFYTSDGHDISDTLGSWTYREPQTQIREYTQTKKNSLLDFYLNYNKDLNSIDSKLDLTAGYSYQHFYNEGENSNRPWVQTNGEYVGADTTEYKNEYFLISFFGRLNYTFKDRYLLTATLRNDGSSRFAEENRWGLFPSVSFAWRINDEAFLKNVDAIYDLKLRIGWGKTGQQDIGDNFYPYIPTYTISQTGAYYQFGNSFYPTQRPDAYDANIKWETTTTQNIGLDFGFYNGRLLGTLDFYKRVTDDLLNEIPIAAGTNFSNFLTTNVGSLENKGVEIGLTGVVVDQSDWTVEVSGNLTYNENKITKLTLVDDPNYPGYNTGGISGGVGNNVQINSIGFPTNTFYLFSQVYDANGMPIEGLYVDKTGNGGNVSGDELNKYYLQNPAPDFLIGLSSRARYKNFDFSFSGRFNIGNYVYNNNASSMGVYQNLYNQSGFNSNILTAVEKTGFMTAQYWSDIYMENASFFRMDNMSLGYSFDKLLTEKLNGRIAFTVQNAFVVTNYSGLDPEVDGGIDNNIFPRPRTFVLGLNINF